jgi:DNA-binding CsgD family transcriptional regulator
MNIETRVSNRAKSIFTALGEIVNDFYLEVGIYFIGGFNALLVAWELYTEMVGTGQPQAYAIAIAIVAFTAVEGLTVFLVGAAAKTNSSLLWFFSVCFALFFTYSHYQANVGNGNMGQYISLAIPIFAVVGYMARTMKANVEKLQVADRQKLQDVEARTRKLEDDRLIREQKAEDAERQNEAEELAHERQNEAEELAHEREMDRFKLTNAQEVTLAKINKNKAANSDMRPILAANTDSLDRARTAKKGQIIERQNEVAGLHKSGKKTSEIAKILNCSADTIRRDIKQLNGKMEAK